MISDNLFIIFLILILIFQFSLKFFLKYYNLDTPGERKIHKNPISTIGGLIFGLIFIIFCFLLESIPIWFIIGSAFSILLGALDDNYNIRWQIKLIVQIILGLYVASYFLDDINKINFYYFTFSLPNILLLTGFLFWFVGIINAVNLIDGIDGLAAGLMILVALPYVFIGENSIFSEINLLLLIILIVFLLHNQRPARIFMGDAGSQFLGYYLAVCPLIFQDFNYYQTNLKVINMTPHIILSSYLIADTTRVFFTRLIEGKSPMAPDTIHFHHLVIQKSGSYLATLFVIYFLASFSGIFVVLDSFSTFNQTGLLIHMSLLLFFILLPPAPTHVKLIALLVNPIYRLNNQKNTKSTLLLSRTLFIALLLLGIFINLIYKIDFEVLFSLRQVFILALLMLVLYIYRGKIISMYIINIFVSFLIINYSFTFESNFLLKLFILLIIISLAIFTLQKVEGTNIRNFSALDLLLFFIVCSAVTISIKPWVFLSIFSSWFGLSFILRRTVYLNN